MTPYKKLGFVSVTVATVLLFSGCAHKQTTASLPYNCKSVQECADIAKAKEEALSQKEQEVQRLQERLSEVQSEAESCRRMAEEAREATYRRVSAVSETTSTTTETTYAEEGVDEEGKPAVKISPRGLTLLPPDARPGECYARVVIPPKYKTEKVKIVVDEGGEKVVTVKPRYEWVTKRVLVREEGEKIIPTPPVYKTVTERVMVRPETEKVVVVKPAKYKWVTERVLVEPEHTVWKRGQALLGGGGKVVLTKGSGSATRSGTTEWDGDSVLDKKLDPQTGEIMCLVKVPAKYKTIRKKVMVEPPVTKTVKVPAEYRTITKKVLVKPAGTKVVKIPAEYKTIRVKEVVNPGGVITKEVPPKYEYVTRKVKVRDIEYKWQPVICKTNMTPGLIKALQRKLKELGFYHGPIDGIYGPMTQRAVEAYQRKNDLAQGALTVETCKALDIL